MVLTGSGSLVGYSNGTNLMADSWAEAANAITVVLVPDGLPRPVGPSGRRIPSSRRVVVRVIFPL